MQNLKEPNPKDIQRHLRDSFSKLLQGVKRGTKKIKNPRAQALLERPCILWETRIEKVPIEITWWRVSKLVLGYCNLDSHFYGESDAGIKNNILTAFCRSSASPAACPPLSTACIKAWIPICCTNSAFNCTKSITRHCFTLCCPLRTAFYYFALRCIALLCAQF